MRLDRLSSVFAWRLGAAAVAVGALTASALAVLPSASASAGITATANAKPKYVFATYDNHGDKAFNQLLGISNDDEIAGYFGSGAKGSPNQGYTLLPPYSQASYTAENYPGSRQTQVTGLNDDGVTVGFYSTQNTKSMNNNNYGFYELDGLYHKVSDPTTDPASPPVSQLLGVNDNDIAVGFYVNGQGFSRSYTYNIAAGTFSKVLEPGHAGASLTATGINNAGDISGFYATNKTSEGFFETGGTFTTLEVPGSSSTMAFGVNDHGEVVGAYTVGYGSNQVTHGFTWTKKGGYVTVNEPNGAGSTFVNGVNDKGDLVGFYSTNGGNVTKGFLAIPAVTQTRNITLSPMPAGTVSFSEGDNSDLDATFSVYGLTPGSAHSLVLLDANGNPVATFSTLLTANAAGVADGTLDSGFEFGYYSESSRLVILSGTNEDDQVQVPIAQTGTFQPTQFTYNLSSVEVTPNGTSYGTPSGAASLVYNPVQKTLAITVVASGVSPGPHAAHIHVGSCLSQGGVLYMLKDLVANSEGSINATRVLTGVTAPIPASGWYLNLHQGNSGDILANGAPTVFFRPLLCSDI